MIDLATWNLTIPVGTPSKVIDTPRLVGGYSDRYFRSGNTLFFLVASDGVYHPQIRVSAQRTT